MLDRLARRGRAPGLQAALALIVLALALVLSARPASAQTPARAAWCVGLVVDCSAAMAQPWLGTTRLSALEGALQLELRTLPLRTKVGVWLVGEGPGQARRFVDPAPAVDVKGLTVILPSLGGAADVAAGVEKAAQWVASAGGGVVVVVAGPGSLGVEAARGLPVGGQGPFCHTVSVGEAGTGGGLEELALQGGGAYFVAGRPGDLSQVMHRAILLGLSSARLMVMAHDQGNQPREVIYGLERRDQLSTRRRGRSGQEAQVLPGVYKLAWPKGAALGPGALPATASVAPTGQTRLWVGGAGRLAVSASGPGGEALPWQASVANLDSGKVEVPQRRLPFEADLPAGYYRVKTISPPLAWTVEVGAGKEVRLATGPQGKLMARLTGPMGPVRLVYTVEDLLGFKQAGAGYTNSPLGLLPGSYRIQVQVTPPLAQRVDIAPGQEAEVDLPLMGALVVRRDQTRGPLTYEVMDARGRTLTNGVGDRPLFMQPGRYLLRLAPSQHLLEVEVTAGQLTSLEAPK